MTVLRNDLQDILTSLQQAIGSVQSTEQTGSIRRDLHSLKSLLAFLNLHDLEQQIHGIEIEFSHEKNICLEKILDLIAVIQKITLPATTAFSDTQRTDSFDYSLEPLLLPAPWISFEESLLVPAEILHDLRVVRLVLEPGEPFPSLRALLIKRRLDELACLVHFEAWLGHAEFGWKELHCLEDDGCQLLGVLFIRAVLSNRIMEIALSDLSMDGLVEIHLEKFDLKICPNRPEPEKIGGEFLSYLQSWTLYAFQTSKALSKPIWILIVWESQVRGLEQMKLLSKVIIQGIRNSIKHGIESQEQRRLCGKGETGALVFESYDIDSRCVIRCLDDGRGVAEDEYEDEYEDLRHLFPDYAPEAAKFDTADIYGGIGVGLQVIEHTVRTSLHGEHDLTSRNGSGAVLKIHFPCDIYYIPCYICSLGKLNFAIPAEHVCGWKRVSMRDLRDDGDGKLFFALWGESIEIKKPSGLLGIWPSDQVILLFVEISKGRRIAYPLDKSYGTQTCAYYSRVNTVFSTVLQEWVLLLTPTIDL